MGNSKRSFQKINAHLDAAKAYAKLSHAERLKVGAVIVRDDRVISVGYNGTPSGRDNACEWFIREDGVKISLRKVKAYSKQQLESKPEVCHAEMNAIMFAAKNGVSTDGCTLVVTHSPCFECSKMIIQCGIKEVFYQIEYRDISPVFFLLDSGVRCMRILQDGDIVSRTR